MFFFELVIPLIHTHFKVKTKVEKWTVFWPVVSLEIEVKNAKQTPEAKANSPRIHMCFTHVVQRWLAAKQSRYHSPSIVLCLTKDTQRIDKGAWKSCATLCPLSFVLCPLSFVRPLSIVCLSLLEQFKFFSGKNWWKIQNLFSTLYFGSQWHFRCVLTPEFSSGVVGSMPPTVPSRISNPI